MNTNTTFSEKVGPKQQQPFKKRLDQNTTFYQKVEPKKQIIIIYINNRMRKTMKWKKNEKRRDRKNKKTKKSRLTRKNKIIKKSRLTRKYKKYNNNNNNNNNNKDYSGGKGALLSLFAEKRSTSVDLLKEAFSNIWKNRECSPELYDSINEYLRLCIWVMKNDSEITEEENMFEHNLSEIAFFISIMSFEFYTNKQYNKCEIVENTKETMRELVDVIKARGRGIPWKYDDENGWIIKENITRLQRP
jgi:hypothetical protein